MDDFEVCRLEPREWAGVFPIVVQLHPPHLTEEKFLREVRQQSHGGYELLGTFHAGRIVGSWAHGRGIRSHVGRTFISTTSSSWRMSGERGADAR